LLGAIGMSKPNRRRRERGLTLLEIMIVIAIIGLVMGLVVVPALFGKLKQSEKEIAQLAVTKLANEAYPHWALANPSQQCPPDMKALTDELGNATADPWGTPYRMLCGANLPQGARHVAVLSLGPDRAENTEDDIKSW